MTPGVSPRPLLSHPRTLPCPLPPPTPGSGPHPSARPHIPRLSGLRVLSGEDDIDVALGALRSASSPRCLGPSHCTHSTAPRFANQVGVVKTRTGPGRRRVSFKSGVRAPRARYPHIVQTTLFPSAFVRRVPSLRATRCSSSARVCASRHFPHAARTLPHATPHILIPTYSPTPGRLVARSRRAPSLQEPTEAASPVWAQPKARPRSVGDCGRADTNKRAACAVSSYDACAAP